MQQAKLRIARPVRDVATTERMYVAAFGFSVLYRFTDDGSGFDGIMLGNPGSPYHFEFTHSNVHEVLPTPTPEDLVVFYLPDKSEWEATCNKALASGFRRVASFNPYWDARGQTFEDADGYRVVLHNFEWTI